MSQLNDCKFDALRAQGYTGAIDDMERSWGIDNGLPEGTTGVPWYNALAAAGYTGHINDMEHKFWCEDGGTFTLRALRGWTDGAECVSDGKIVIDFNTEVFFTDHTSVVFRNRTTGDIAQPSGGAYTTDETSGTSKRLSYNNVTWNVDPVQGDEIRWSYGFEPVLLDNFDSSPAGTSISDAGHSPQIGGPWISVDSTNHVISVDGNSASAVNNVGSYWANVINTAPNPSVFMQVKYVSGDVGSVGVMLRSAAAPAAANSAFYIAIIPNASGQIAAITLHNWSGVQLDSTQNPFTGVNLQSDAGVEFFFEDKAANGVDITAGGITVNLTHPTFEAAINTHIGLYSQNNPFAPSATAEDRRILNFAVVNHPTGNYQDADAVPMEEQGLDLTNCLDPIGTYTSSIYQGKKDTATGEESLATGVTKVQVSAASGAGTVTLSVDGVPLSPVFDTTKHSSFHWAVSGSVVSWVSTVTDFELGQGK